VLKSNDCGAGRERDGAGDQTRREVPAALPPVGLLALRPREARDHGAPPCCVCLLIVLRLSINRVYLLIVLRLSINRGTNRGAHSRKTHTDQGIERLEAIRSSRLR